MKKILILALSILGSLGLTFGTALAFSADEVSISSLNDLKGKELVFIDEITEGLTGESWNIYFDFSCNGVDYTNINYNEGRGDLYYDATMVNESLWEDDIYKTIIVDENTSFTFSGITEENAIFFFNTNLAEINTPAPPVETPTMWQSILSGIGGFLSGMFGLLTGLFSGVGAVFYTNNAATIILQALIFAAAAGLVAAAVYVIVRLIKSAVARLRGGVGAAGTKGGAREKAAKKRFRFYRRRK